MRLNYNFLFVLTLLLCIVSVPDRVVAQVDTVLFRIDMHVPIEAGWFDPTSETVGIRGSIEPLSWNQGAVATDPDGDGLFEALVGFANLQADSVRIAYKVKVDGAGNPNDGWETGDNRTFVLRQADQVVERAFNDATAPIPSTRTGQMEEHPAFVSQYVDARDVYVYLPPGYEEGTDRRYPVLYMHDGLNVFDAVEAGMEWQVDETAQRLIEAGTIEPVIIVGVGNTPKRVYEYTPTASAQRDVLPKEPVTGSEDATYPLDQYTGRYRFGEEQFLELIRKDDTLLASLPGSDEPPIPLTPQTDSTFFAAAVGRTLRFEKGANGKVVRMIAEAERQGGGGAMYGRFLVEELKPFIDRTYRTRPGREHTGVGGSSLGGLISMYLGLQYPEVYSKLLVVSPSVWWDEEVIVEDVEKMQQKPDQKIWLDMGTGEGESMVSGAEHLYEALTAKGFVPDQDLKFVLDEGAEHNETAWAGRVEEMLRFLFPAHP